MALEPVFPQNTATNITQTASPQPTSEFIHASAPQTYTAVNQPTPIVDSRVNTHLPLFILADELSYDSGGSEIYASGNVIIKHEDISIFANKAYINAKSGDVKAEGNILVMQGKTRIYTEKLFYNLKDKNAYTESVVIKDPPWIIKGAKMMQEGKKIQVETPMLTTCDKEKPHYRMESSMITMWLDDRVEAWNTVMYLGTIPVFYFPYYSQTIKGKKTPFDIQGGNSADLGWYVRVRYNFFLDELNSGSIGYDYMEKKGNNYLLGMTYGFNESSKGNFQVTYNNDRSTLKDRWSLTAAHTQQLGKYLIANASVAYVTDMNMAKDLNVAVDNYQQRSFISLSSTNIANHSFYIAASDVQTLNPITMRYETTERILPSLTYSMTSTPLFSKLMYSHTVGLTRRYIVGGNYFKDDGYLRPVLATSFNLLSFPVLTSAISGNMNFSSDWNNIEKPPGELTPAEREVSSNILKNSVGTSENFNITFALPASAVRFMAAENLGHYFSRQLNEAETLPHMGIISNSLNGSFNSTIGILNFTANGTYDLLSDKAQLEDEKDRFSPVYLTAYMNYHEFNLSASSSYIVYADMMKNLSISLGISDVEKSLWSINATTSYVNNLIDGRGRPTLNVKDSITFSNYITLALTKEFNVSMAQVYDLTEKRITAQNYSLVWHVHCWDVSLNYTITPYADSTVPGGYRDKPSYAFGINITAFPQHKLTKTDTVPNIAAYNLPFGND